ncbi:MAG: dTDP-glucose 4,6-dehydratase [Candidatus Omnitrophota bacterium]|nr:dTDP-glucose 4,6-dehydratase [Candidatus Omnitrophota bacterium]MDZ4241385.1 dTDP-glucose 4,6-dehydratase [Candidatus Omnitrophota bacterium]
MGKKMKYLVTGGAGFIGSNFVEYLYRHERNIEVCVLDKLTYSGNIENLRPFMGRADFEFIKGDICDEAAVRRAMAGAGVVVNFAAEAAVDRSIDDPQAFLKTDIFGVYILLQEARKLKSLKRFVQISTDEVYGHILKGSFSETSVLKPRNPYAASKLGGERLAFSFFETYRLPVVITRASNNYGPQAYPEKVIPLFITNLVDGLPVPVYGKGAQVRDWLYVEDHCRAIHLLVRRGVNGEVYNVGGGQECANLKLTKMILGHVGRDEHMIRFVKDRPGHDFRYSLNCAKLRRLGWEPRYRLKEGLKLTVDWYREHEDWWRPLKNNLDKRYVTGFWNGTKNKKGK